MYIAISTLPLAEAHSTAELIDVPLSDCESLFWTKITAAEGGEDIL